MCFTTYVSEGTLQPRPGEVSVVVPFCEHHAAYETELLLACAVPGCRKGRGAEGWDGGYDREIWSGLEETGDLYNTEDKNNTGKYKSVTHIHSCSFMGLLLLCHTASQKQHNNNKH